MISEVCTEVVVVAAMNPCSSRAFVDEFEVGGVATCQEIEPDLNLPGCAEHAQNDRSGRGEVTNLDTDVGQMLLDRVRKGNLGRRLH
ncbi:hypothetical protein D9M69_608250 [compost metagenome]